MGQQSSSNNDTVNCCTTRGDDEARPGESLVYASCQVKEDRSLVKPARSGQKDGAFDIDGGTGGTGAEPVRQEECGLMDLSAFSCVEDRSGDQAAGRRALFGDKSLKPKLVRLRNYEVEVEALKQIRIQISKRLPEAGKPMAMPAQIEAGAGVIPETEFIRRLRLHEESLAGVPEKFVTQACARVLGALAPVDSKEAGLVERPVNLKEMKAHYAEILTNVDFLVKERVAESNSELNKLDSEVGELEDLIALCFDKMDEEAAGSITSAAFVEFVCEQETVEHEEEGAITVSEEDAERLFILMSNGQVDLTYEQFKDEITAGCLQVMHHNLLMRREIQKRYRDYWF